MGALSGQPHSVSAKLKLDAEAGYEHELVVDQIIPPIPLPADTRWVKRFKMESQILTEFWGKPIYFGATVLLPRGYERETIDYPVVYLQGHFSTADPMRFKEGEDLHRQWIRDNFPRMIVVTFQDPTPYFDTSYSVNSVNVGPYGDAILEELIPEIESRFRVIDEPYARILTGGSTGGWEALAMQIFYPDFFGGAFAYAPDPVTFTNVEGINIYEDVNAFYKQHEWRRVPTANTRNQTGRGESSRPSSETATSSSPAPGAARASSSTSGRRSSVRSARTATSSRCSTSARGEIDREVAEYWRENFDLLHLHEDQLVEPRPQARSARSTSIAATWTTTT